MDKQVDHAKTLEQFLNSRSDLTNRELGVVSARFNQGLCDTELEMAAVIRELRIKDKKVIK